MIRHGLVHDSPGYVCPFCPDREHKYPRPDNLQRYVYWPTPPPLTLEPFVLIAANLFAQADMSGSITWTRTKMICNLGKCFRKDPKVQAEVEGGGAGQPELLRSQRLLHFQDLQAMLTDES